MMDIFGDEPEDHLDKHRYGMIKMVFCQLDYDGDGELDAEELARFAQVYKDNPHVPFSKKRCEVLERTVDFWLPAFIS